MTTMIVDGDEVLFRATVVTQTTFDWEEGDGPQTVGDFNAARRMIISEIELAEERLNASGIVVALSSSTNYRKDLYSEYKANRSGHKPADYEDCRRWLMDHYETTEAPGLEADDMIGMASGCHIASSDKDMDTLPGRIRYSFYHHEVYGALSEFKADWNLFQQALAGDSSDNYPGCPGIGMKRAAKLLADCQTLAALEEATIEAFEAKGLTADHALRSVRLARILRGGEYDWTTLSPILYTWSFDAA